MHDIYDMFVYTCSYNRQPLSPLQKDVWAIGKVEVKHLPNSELELLNAHFGTTSTLLPVFYRVQKGSAFFYSMQYTRVKIRNSYTVSYKVAGTVCHGQIMYFVIIEQQATALLRRLLTLSMPDEFQPVFSVIPVQCSGRIDIVNVCDIIEKCVYIDVGSTYIAKFPCTLHFD